MRLLRCLRITKLVRILQSSAVVQEWRETLTLSCAVRAAIVAGVGEIEGSTESASECNGGSETAAVRLASPFHQRCSGCFQGCDTVFAVLRGCPAVSRGWSSASAPQNLPLWSQVQDLIALVCGTLAVAHWLACLLGQRLERDRAHGYFSSSEVQKTCSFGPLAFWLLIFPSPSCSPYI